MDKVIILLITPILNGMVVIISLTNLTVGYDRKHWGLTFNVQNLFDKRYAVDVNKDASGSRVSFTPGMPRTFMGYVSYKF